MRVIFLGPQGAGKGTISSRVSAKLKIPHISTGDLFRDAIAAQTPLGKEAKKSIDQGKLVPDLITNALIREHVEKKRCKKGFILDGYPRNISQAKSLDSFALPTQVILLDIPEQVSIERLAGRLQCKICKRVFNINAREDDKPQVIKQRLAAYRAETEPIVDYYKKQKKLHRIDATPTVEIILKKIFRVLC
ncbi:adenylate kinase [Candidatus Woesearchaeota archaeon]|nr:adenylate kinase [Candidatus Woesearchaeota archaeon]